MPSISICDFCGDITEGGTYSRSPSGRPRFACHACPTPSYLLPVQPRTTLRQRLADAALSCWLGPLVWALGKR